MHCTKDNHFDHIIRPEDNELILRHDTPIFACKFAQQSSNEHIVGLVNEDGKLAVHNCETNARYGREVHHNAIFDLAWAFQQMKIVTVSGDHTCRMFDVSGSDIRLEKIYFGHDSSVKTVAFQRDNSRVFASGGRDGQIIIRDSRSRHCCFVKDFDDRIVNSHNFGSPSSSKLRKNQRCIQTSVKSVTGLVFQDETKLISCGAGDGAIKVWDLRKHYSSRLDPLPSYVFNYPGRTSKQGYSSLVLDDSGFKLYANCLDNTIYCYNLASYNKRPIMRYVGHENSTFYIKSCLNGSGRYLISGSSDGNAYIWDVNSSQPIIKLTGHNAEVTCVAWCNKKDVLVTCSDDITHKVWTVGPEEWKNDENGSFGRAEVLPLKGDLPEKILNRLKRIADENLSYSPKRFVKACLRCDVSTNNEKFCDNCNVTPSKRKADDLFSNENKRFHTDLGPKRLFSETSTNTNQIDGSPTVNLPNFVVDGTAPHLNYSPPKRPKQDWLTRLRIERNLRQEMQNIVNGEEEPSDKKPKLELIASPKNMKKTVEKKCSSPLLRFFKVTNKTRDMGCSSGKTNENFFNGSPQYSQ